ncbi:MAG: hypothetical protein HF314_13475 [Ignavibacteria bacterium]|jgi:hypothetical protein|nr:hypothetical protein [Ignavibacteria bacterium]MCU7504087.1 hypothetical protein [Ignavibacteria bacterium]MCU7516463.1 hypothetical protein [Ignavibacteria bacterium]
MNGKLLFVLVLLALILGCQKDSGPLAFRDLLTAQAGNGKAFYMGKWEIEANSPDSLQFYTFQLKLDFDKSLYAWPEVNYGQGNVEVNAAVIYLDAFVLYGDSLNYQSGGAEPVLKNYFLDSLIILKDKLSRIYHLKISRKKLSKYPLRNRQGQVNLVLAWYVCTGYLKDATSHLALRRWVCYSAGQSAFYLPLEKRIVNFSS